MNVRQRRDLAVVVIVAFAVAVAFFGMGYVASVMDPRVRFLLGGVLSGVVGIGVAWIIYVAVDQFWQTLGSGE